MNRSRLFFFCCLFCITKTVGAGDIPTNEIPQASQKQEPAAINHAFSAVTNTDSVHIWPSVMADRDKGTVEILAESTGMQPGEPVEFFLITPASGHDYEAFAVSFAKAKDIRNALEFIGIPPGQPADYASFQMWPQGERVIIEVAPNHSPVEAPAPPDTEWIRAEEFILEPDGNTLPEDGFVFTGSYYMPDGQLAPDADTPHSIAAFYNEPQTVFDVPRIAPQGAVYGRTEINPSIQPKEGTLLRMRFRHDGAPLPRAIKLDITFSLSANQHAEGLNHYMFSCRNGNNTVLTNVPISKLLALFREYQKQRRDIYISVIPNPDVSIGRHKDIYTFFETINKPDGARLIAPDGQILYYKAFLPDMRFRDRSNRPGQPWELYLEKNNNGNVTGTLIHIEESWLPNDTQRFDETTYPIASPKELPALLAKYPDTFKVIFFFCSDDLALRDIIPWYSILYPEYKTIYFYHPETPGTSLHNSKTKESEDER